MEKHVAESHGTHRYPVRGGRKKTWDTHTNSTSTKATILGWWFEPL